MRHPASLECRLAVMLGFAVFGLIAACGGSYHAASR
jgi:hypothetical protein